MPARKPSASLKPSDESYAKPAASSWPRLRCGSRRRKWYRCPLDRAGELLEALLLGGDPRGVVRGRVAAVETDLGAGVEQRLDESRAEPLVLLGGRPVELVRVLGHEEEGRRGAAAPLVGEDPVEAPEGVGAARLVQRRAGESAQLAQPRTDTPADQVRLRASSCSLEPDPRPLPRRVDVVRERDRETRAAPARRFRAELSPQPFEGRVERVETGGRRPEAVVLVTRAVSLLDAGEVEERLGQRTSRGRSPRSTCSQASGSYATSSPKPTSRAPIESSTQRALRSTASGIKRRHPS